jgi:hypothetical protein
MAQIKTIRLAPNEWHWLPGTNLRARFSGWWPTTVRYLETLRTLTQVQVYVEVHGIVIERWYDSRWPISWSQTPLRARRGRRTLEVLPLTGDQADTIVLHHAA